MARPSREEVDKFIQAEYEILVRILRAKLQLSDLEAIDLAHEAVSRIYDSLGNFDSEKGNLQQWSRGILKNMVLQFREGRMRPLILDTAVEHRPDRKGERIIGDAVAEDIAGFIRQSVDRLPEIYRDVLRLRYLEGLDLKSIAKRLDVPIGTVKARLFRAPALLKDALSIQETTARFYLDQLGRMPPVKP